MNPETVQTNQHTPFCPMNFAHDIRQAFCDRLDRPLLNEDLFDHVPDIAFFIKDHLGRYVAVNETLVQRCGMQSKEDLIGKTADEVFPSGLGDTFAQQDQKVLKTALSFHGQLELHLYPGGRKGWCLTYKEPILDKDSLIIGVSGISRDLHSSAEDADDLTTISSILAHIRNNIDKPLRLPELAEMAKLSVYQLDQRLRSLYHMSAGQCITHARIDAACHMLTASGKSISNIALDCGYSDQSAFTRQFKQTTGITPKAYRDRK